MSRALENDNITEAGIGPGAGTLLPLCSVLTILTRHRHPIGHHQYPPQSAPTQAPQGMSNFVDGSGPVFSMYLEMATEEDKKMVEGWKADADGSLIFVRRYLLVPCFKPTHLS